MGTGGFHEDGIPIFVFFIKICIWWKKNEDGVSFKGEGSVTPYFSPSI
jgi:hypothetical protein